MCSIHCYCLCSSRSLAPQQPVKEFSTATQVTSFLLHTPHRAYGLCPNFLQVPLDLFLKFCSKFYSEPPLWRSWASPPPAATIPPTEVDPRLAALPAARRALPFRGPVTSEVSLSPAGVLVAQEHNTVLTHHELQREAGPEQGHVEPPHPPSPPSPLPLPPLQPLPLTPCPCSSLTLSPWAPAVSAQFYSYNM